MNLVQGWRADYAGQPDNHHVTALDGLRSAATLAPEKTAIASFVKVSGG